MLRIRTFSAISAISAIFGGWLIFSECYAAEAPTVDLSKPLSEISGKPVMDEATRASEDPAGKDPDCSSCKPITAAAIVIRALLSNAPSEQNIPGEQKLARWALAKRIQDNPSSVVLQSSEVTLIKRLVGTFPPTAVAGVYPLIAPNDAIPTVAP
jgi:hypothetical protein